MCAHIPMNDARALRERGREPRQHASIFCQGETHPASVLVGLPARDDDSGDQQFAVDFVAHAPHVQRGRVQVSAFDVADSLVELVVGNDEVKPLQVVVEPMVRKLQRTNDVDEACLHRVSVGESTEPGRAPRWVKSPSSERIMSVIPARCRLTSWWSAQRARRPP
jgi:hypothetical protein